MQNKDKSCQKPEIWEFKLDTWSDGNLVPIKKYKMLSFQTNINELNKSIKK